MYDAVAIGELLIDFMVERQLDDGYPVMAAVRAGRRPISWRPCPNLEERPE